MALGPLRASPRRRASLPSSVRLIARDVDFLLYSKPGTRVLLTIAAMGQTDVIDLHASVGIDRRYAWNVINRWQREGVIRSVQMGRRRVVELDPSFAGADALRRVLAAACYGHGRIRGPCASLDTSS